MQNICTFLVCAIYLLHPSYSQFYVPRENLEFEIQAVYKSELPSFGIRGSGLGLNWETTSEMVPVDGQTWSYVVKFDADEFGFRCSNCVDISESFIPYGDKLKIKFYTNMNGTEFASLGASYDIRLPVSKLSSYYQKKPVFTFNPYFFTKEGVTFSLDIDSGHEILGTRNVVAYVPPSQYF